MKLNPLLTFTAFLGLAVCCSPLLAHHGNAAFAEKPITLKQVKVTSFSWANPHSLIEFDAKDDQGKMQHWVVETAAPQALVLIGWSKTSLQPGDVITVTTYQAKTGAPRAACRKSYSRTAPSCTIPNWAPTAPARGDTTIRMAKHPRQEIRTAFRAIGGSISGTRYQRISSCSSSQAQPLAWDAFVLRGLCGHLSRPLRRTDSDA